MFRSIKILTILLVMACNSWAAFQPLEIYMPKTAGSGSPAIPSTHPVFRAYTGIEYNVQVSVGGGAYPFAYSLSGQPSGMVVSSGGVVSWPNPTTGTHGPIAVTVTDTENTEVSSSWSVVVGTSGYTFIDSAYSGTESGSITQPYSSIINMLNASVPNTDIVYFRSGLYALPVYQPDDGNNADCNMSYSTGEPTNWLGYPGETITVDCNSNYLQGGDTSWYVDRINFIDIPDWLFHEVPSGHDYTVIRRCDISGARFVYRFDNGNQGIYYTESAGDGYYLLFSDNTVHGVNGPSGFGSLYNQEKMVIHGNEFYDFDSATFYPVLAVKFENNYVDIRANYIHDIVGAVIGSGVNGMFSNASYTNISFNRIITSGQYALWLNANYDTSPQMTTNIERNTIDGYVVISGINGDTCASNGPWSFKNNVIINDGVTTYDNVDVYTLRYPSGTNPFLCLSITDDLIGDTTDNIIDSDGLLVGSYRTTYLGVNGWEMLEHDAPIVTILTESQSTTSETITIIGTLTPDSELTATGVDVNGEEATSSDGFATWSAVVPLTLGANTITATGTDSNSGTDSDTTVVTRTSPPSGNVIYTGSMSGGSYR